MKNLAIAVLLATLLAACATPKPVAKSEESSPAPVTEGKRTEPTAPTVSSPEAVASVDQDPLNDRNSMLAKRSLYYPLDGYVVQDEDKSAVQAHARYLAEHPNRKVRLEGHADERGSNEYNLALGQRRADGVKNMLMLGGAKSDQIETASYGEEKPKATEHDESAWSQNRRTDIIYK